MFTYQAASGAGLPGLKELEREMACLVASEPIEKDCTFRFQQLANLIPQIGGFDEAGYTSEEMKMQKRRSKDYALA